MNIIFVVDRIRDWPFANAGAAVVTAGLYLADPRYAQAQAWKVFNLCDCGHYQGRGYYVSMLAEARGHAPLPDVKAIEDLGSPGMDTLLADRFDAPLQGWLAGVEGVKGVDGVNGMNGDTFELDIHFGRGAGGRLPQFSEQLFNLLRMPLLRVAFARCGEGMRSADRRWRIASVRALTLARMDPLARRQAALAATECVKGHGQRSREPAATRPTVAILRSPDCPALPSNSIAIRKFQEAAESLGMRSEVLTHDDAERIVGTKGKPGFDGLFIRDTTRVNHYTYQVARQAALAGMIVMDDPDSILKCNNKIYMNELLGRHGLPMPRAMVVHRGNLDRVIATLGLPCVLKQPDGAFSIGVEKIRSPEELQAKAERLFATSELLLAQEYLPTEFDWRIGILDRKPLFACRYFMAPGHWQIIHRDDGQTAREGAAEALAVRAAPPRVVDTALRAANLIGDGFYGVDLKQHGQQCCVIEINDNPNVDAGNEDGVLHDALYVEVMSVFRKRIEARKGSMA